MNRKILLILFILISVCAISHASAAAADIAAQADSGDIETQMLDEEIIETSASDEPALENDDGHDNILKEGATHHVTPQDDIQKAVDSANAGDTIVLNGSFTLEKEIKINKTLNIVGYGEGAELKVSTFVPNRDRVFNIESTASNVILNNLMCRYYRSDGCGGAILWQGSNGLVKDCEFISGDYIGTYGAAIVIRGDNCNIEKCTFSKNTADLYGGAVVVEGDNCNISNCNFNGNRANQYGGAVVLSGSNGRIMNCTFNVNHAAKKGGAVVVNGTDNEILNCNFTENYVSDSANISDNLGGGAIFSDCDTLKIDGCNFTKNAASASFGGAIISGKSNRIRNSFFMDNSALLGNAIYSSSISYVMSNVFVIPYNGTKGDEIYGSEISVSDDNTFERKKLDSVVKFTASMIFEYGATGSIYVTVEGGIIKPQDIWVLNHNEAKIGYSKNMISISNLPVGTFKLCVRTTPDENHTSVESDLGITVKKATAVIKASKLTVAYKSGASWTIKIVDSRNNKPIANMKLTLKVFTGKKYKVVTLTTNSKGEASYKTKKLSKGNHKVEVSASHAGYNFNRLKSSIKVIKPTPLKYKLQAKVNDNGGALLSYMVLNKKTKKGVNGIKIKVLIFTGKKYKAYTLKTKKVKGKKKTYHGAIGFSTNEFSVGKHKVKLMPVSIKYKGSTVTSIKINKASKKIPPYFRKI